MPEFKPVTTLLDLHSLCEAEVIAGYHAGAEGLPEPAASCFSRSYWHGWCTGAADAGLIDPTPEQRLLAHSIAIWQGASTRADPNEPEGYVFPWH